MITLVKLTLRNFAVVSSTEINLQRGLTVITGETGAGKSLVVGAISLLLGERGRSEYVRSGAKAAEIEGTFHGDFSSLRGIFETEKVIADGNELTLIREITPDGKSRCLVNDQRVGLNALKQIGEQICDLHGQHQHQWLLDPLRHLWFLDRYADSGKLFRRYLASFNEYRSIKSRLKELEEKIKRDQDKRELWQYQLKEIQGARLSVDEEASSETERKTLENIAKIKEVLYGCRQRIECEGGLLTSTAQIQKNLSSICEHFPAIASLLTDLESTKIFFSELNRVLDQHLSNLYENPARLEQIGERLSSIYQLKRKYGGSAEAILAHAAEIESFLGTSDTQEKEAQELKTKLEQAARITIDAARALQKMRESASAKLTRQMKTELKHLGLQNAKFEVLFQDNQTGESLEIDKQQYLLSEAGSQTAEFLFSANVGEELKPLAKIASGGEISRVMLALKSLISGQDRVALLVFDEIDSGIGGETAFLVGRKLKQLASRQQVVAITHLQQIASFSDNHLKAVKKRVGNRTESELLPLEASERIVELGRMISGGKFGDEEKRQAEKLLELARENLSVDN